MNIIVTGGAGFIGSNLVDALIDKGHKVTVIDNLSTGKVENLNKNCQFLQADLFEMPQEALNAALKGIDFVFHLAAKARVQPSIADPLTFNDHNVVATLKLLEASRLSGSVKRFIFSSSSSVYGQSDILPFKETMSTNPISPYALQKLIGEQYCRLYSSIYHLETVCLRYFNVYGNRQPTSGAYCTVLGIFKGQERDGKPLTITNDGEQKRDFTHVSDVVAANILAMEVSSDLERNPNVLFNGQAFNVGFGKSVSINEIASYFKGEKIYTGKVLEPRETLADNYKAKYLLGWEPKIAITKELIDSL